MMQLDAMQGNKDVLKSKTKPCFEEASGMIFLCFCWPLPVFQGTGLGFLGPDDSGILKMS